MAGVLTEAYFSDEAAAFEELERIVWPNVPVCPFCGNMGRFYTLEGVRTKPSKKNPEGMIRHGLRKCGECRKQFTVRKNTLFEDSPVPLHLWFQTAYLLCSSKKGISSNQLSRTLGVTLQTAWFMSHRMREAMRPGPLAPMGGAGSIVEVDETAFGRIKGAPKKGRALGGRSGFRNTVLTLVERSGTARSFHIDDSSIAKIKPVVQANLAREAGMMTDEWSAYGEIGKGFATHDTVNHSKEEYVRYEGDKVISTNTVEGFYSIFKRGMKGVYQHCDEKHLHRYLAEFDFRYNNRVRLGVNDSGRTEAALRGIVGKRLTYRDSLGAAR
jgi:transposase-like protein